MVAVDAQILAGVAVTVLLALLFFGVVVLWDVALALRGVADKVDKLEDTLDDDLTDLERAVDGTPGGSGPQVHLNGGGTITPGGPGAAPGPQSPSGRSGGAAGGSGRTHAAHAQSDDPQSAPAASASTDAETAAGEAGRAEQTAPSTEAGEPTGDDSKTQPRAAVGADPTPVRETSPSEADRSGTDDEMEDDETTENPDESDDRESHPRAELNRGRFVTSPDRTAWYRTPLDRRAIAEARQPIAGELEAGDASPEDSTERDAEPVVAEAPTESSEEPIAVGPGGPAEPVDPTDPGDDHAEAATSETESTDTEPSSGASVVSVSETGTTDADESPDDPPSDAGAADRDSPPEAAAADATGRSTGDEADADQSPADEGSDGTAPEDQSDREDAGDGDEVSEQPAAEDDSMNDPDEGEPIDGVSSPEADAAESTSDAEQQATETRSEASPSEPGADDPDATDDAAGVADEPTGQSTEASGEALDPDEGLEFTFEEFSPAESTEPEVTVDEAVRTVNDETPSLSRSAHGIESRAETEEDGVVLVYDLEDTESSGSTTRLLRYQLDSFAAESDAEVDVTVSGNRVVVDIPGADGADVSQWQSAVVEVIDRTLYLSDNSE